MSSSNYCFLTWIQISQEMAKEVWYSHLFQNFPQFVVIHTVKGFGIVNKAEVDVFLELSCFFYIKVGECYFCLSHLLRCTTIFHNQADSNTCYFFTVRTTKSSIVHSNFNHIEMSSDPVLYWMPSEGTFIKLLIPFLRIFSIRHYNLLTLLCLIMNDRHKENISSFQ